MKQVFKTALVLTAVFFLYTATGYSDTVRLENGDRLIGSVQDNYFAIQAPYGRLVIKRNFMKALSITNPQAFDGNFQTVNNDLFSGSVLNRKINIRFEDKTDKIISMQEIKEILFDTATVRKPMVTTVFTMNNNDRFSGQLLEERITVRTAGTTLAYARKQLNRLYFLPGPDEDVSLLSIAGDLVNGHLLLDSIRIAPDSIARLTVNKSEFKAIQFNARKMLSNNYRMLAAADKDADGDGVADDADACDDTLWGEPIDIDGCSKQPAPKQTLATKTRAEYTGSPVIPDILFDFDSEKIKSRYYLVLDGIIAVLKTNPALRIEIGGHTDNVGPENYNQDLSEKRARTAKQYMIDRGIAAQRITAVGYGSTRNIASNENVSGRVLNRRVNVVWVK